MAFFCLLVNPSPSLFSAFSSSALRTDSAFPRSALIVGTVSKESLHASKDICSSFRRTSASAAALARASVLAATTSFKSSTLYTMEPQESTEISAAMLRGTEMSTNLRTPPTASGAAGMFATSDAWMSNSSDPEAAKITSELATHSINSGMRWISKSTSGNSSARASQRGRDLFKRVILLHPFECKCLTNNFDIFPAPIMHTRASSNVLPGSFN
mmetsp:Transcript_7630/g.15307  ORF Transcript_7630/g.15307 Transcript_7630/m.15307 type:complete len:214 (+) Transcript_7630:330-971(+)